MNLFGITLLLVTFIAISAGGPLSVDLKRYYCDGPYNDVNDADCQKDEYKSTVACYFGGEDPSYRSCAVQCNDQLASQVPGKICYDYCGGYINAYCDLKPQSTVPRPTTTTSTTSTTTTTTSPTYTVPSTMHIPNTTRSLTDEEIGGIVGAILLVLAIGIALVCYKKCKRCREENQKAEKKSLGDESKRPMTRSSTELSSTGSTDTDRLAVVDDTTETKDTIQCSKPVAATEDLQDEADRANRNQNNGEINNDDAAVDH